MTKGLLSVQEAAKLLKISSQTLRRWDESGLLVPLRTQGNQRRYTRKQIREFSLDRSLRKSVPQTKLPSPTLPSEFQSERATRLSEISENGSTTFIPKWLSYTGLAVGLASLVVGTGYVLNSELIQNSNQKSSMTASSIPQERQETRILSDKSEASSKSSLSWEEAGMGFLLGFAQAEHSVSQTVTDGLFGSSREEDSATNSEAVLGISTTASGLITNVRDFFSQWLTPLNTYLATTFSEINPFNRDEEDHDQIADQAGSEDRIAQESFSATGSAELENKVADLETQLGDSVSKLEDRISEVRNVGNQGDLQNTSLITSLDGKVLDLDKLVTASDKSYVSLTLTKTLNVGGNTTLKGVTTIDGDLRLTSTFTVDNLSKQITLGTISILGGDLTVPGTTTLKGNASLGNGTDDLIAINGRVSTSLIPNPTGALDLGTSDLRWNNLYVNNLVATSQTISGLSTNGDATIGGTLGVTGATTLSSTLRTNGAANFFSTLGVNGNVGVGTTNVGSYALSVVGTTNITAALTLGSTLDVTGAITAPTSSNTINGLIINSGALSGISTISASGAITAATSSNTINGLVISSGALTSVTGITTSGGYNQSGSNLNYFSGNVGIGFSSPGGSLGVAGNLGVGFSYARFSPPTNGLMVEGSVGIGTTNPGTTLDVTGTGRFSSTLTASNGLTQTTGALSLTATSGSAALTLTSSATAFNVNSGLFNIDTANSFVGVGTTSPGSKLGVAGGLGVGISYAIAAAPTNGLAVQGSVGVGITSPGQTLSIAGNVGIGFSYSRFSTGPTNGLMVEGSLGVGTTNPTSALSVGSTSQFQVNTSGVIAAAAGVTSSGTITFSGLGTGIVLSSSSGVLSNSLGTANYVTKWTSTGLSTTSLVFDDATNVGVGTTSPGSKLGVAGGLGVGISYAIAAAPTNGLIVQGSVGVGTTTAGSTLNVNGNSVIGFGLGSVAAPSNGLAVQGSVGIGVSSPSNTLGVAGSVGIGYSYARAAGPTNGLAVQGDVGIGTTSPGTTLDVTGTGRFSSTLTASNGLTLTTGALSLTATSGSAALTLTSSATAFNINSGLFNIDTANSFVGVGTTSPGSKLGVAGGLGVGISYSTLAAPTNGLIVQGSVGVGTTTAGSTLNVNGNSVIGFGLGSVVAPTNGLAVNGSVGIGVSSPSNTLGVAGSVGIGYSYARAAGPTNGLAVEGDVGIGTTSPNSQLNVYGSAGTGVPVAGAGALLVSDSANGTAGNGGALLFGAVNQYWAGIKGYIVNSTSNSSGHLDFFTRNQASDASLTRQMRLMANGYLAIGTGTNDGGSFLSVAGNGTIGFSGTAIAPTNGLAVQGSVGIGVSSPSNTLGVAGSVGIGYSYARAAGPSNGLAVQGDVGIGTTSPGTTLDVTGTGRFSSTLTASNGLTVTAGGETITAGNLGVNTSINAAYAVNIGGSSLSGTTQIGLLSAPTYSSSATSEGVGLYVQPATAAASFTLTTATGLRVDNTSEGAGSAITTMRGIYVNSMTAGSTSNYGIYVDTPSGSATDIGLYVAGGDYAAVFAAGNVGIGTATPATLLELSSATSGANMLQITNTDAGAFGPLATIYHNSASPAASDEVGALSFAGKSSTDTKRTFTNILSRVTDPTNASEDAELEFYNMRAGTLTEAMSIDSLGTLLVNSTSLVSTSGQDYRIQAQDTGFASSDGDGGTLALFSTTAATSGADTGTGLAFGGYYTGTSTASWSRIRGPKTNSTDTNYSGYLAFDTRTSGGNLTEKMRIDNAGLVGIGVTPGDHLHVVSTTNQKGITLAGSVDNTSLIMTNSGTGGTTYRISSTGGTSGFGQGSFVIERNGSQVIEIDSSSKLTTSNGLGVTGNVDIGAAFTNNDGTLNLNGSMKLGGANRSILNGDNNYLALGTNNTERLVINADGTANYSGGNFGIGATSPSYILHAIYTGDGVVARFTDTSGSCDINPTSTSLSCASDESLKKDIVGLNGGLGDVLALRPVNFRWKNQTTSDIRTGFIAQEVEQVIPELVATDEKTGLKSVNYVGFGPVLVAALQEQQKQIDTLKLTSSFPTNLVVDRSGKVVVDAPGLETLDSRITNLESVVGELNAKITELESKIATPSASPGPN